MKIPSAIGLILKNARTMAGLSQQELSNASKVDRTYISLLERGERQPTVTILIKLCRHLKTKPSEILREYEKQYW